MKIDLVQIILLLAAGQGFLLAALILHKHRSYTATRFLGALMLLLPIVLINLILSESKSLLEEPLWLIPIGLPLAFGPLQYLYTKYLIRPGERLNRTDWFHFSLYGLYVAAAFGCLASTSVRQVCLGQALQDVPVSMLGFNVVLAVNGIVYAALSIRTIHRQTRNLESVFSNPDRVRLDWLRRLSLAFLVGWFCLLAETVFFIAGGQFGPRFAISSGIGGMLVYASGYLGLVRSDVFLKPEIAGSMRELSETEDGEDAKSALQHPAGKYRKSGLPPDKASECRDALLRLMETERPYINPDLTLAILANKLSVSTHNLSEVINTQFNQNFFDFVNMYRVEQAKHNLIDPQKKEWKILAIAYETGFNSKTSFNTLFKKHTGLSPSEFREQSNPV